MVQQEDNALDRFLDITNTKNFEIGEYIPNIFILDTGCNGNDGDTMYNAITCKIEQATDDSGHGTFIHELIHYINPMANIYHVKVLDNSSSDARTVDNAFTYLRGLQQRGIKIDLVCCSFGADAQINNKTFMTIKKIHKEGTLFFSSIGNDNKHLVYTPANLPEFLCVGGLSSDDIEFNTRWVRSNYSRITDIMALAENIDVPNNNIKIDGTSFANAIVVGQVSKLMSKYANVTKDDIKDRLSNIDNMMSLNTANGYLILK